MKSVQFLSNSVQIENIVKGLTLSKSLFVSTILIGEPHSGQTELSKEYCSQTAVYRWRKSAES